RAADAVGKDRRDFLADTVLPLHAFARDHSETGSAVKFAVQRDEFRNIGWIVLTIAIERDDQLGPRRPDAGPHGPALTQVSCMRDNPNVQARAKTHQFGGSPVSRSVIDENDF